MGFLRSVARILVKNAGNALGLGLGHSALEIWDAWNAETQDQHAKLEDVQHVAQLTVAETRHLAEQLTLELASDQPESVRQEIAAVLTQIPAATRQSLRRPADPSGRSLRPNMVLNGPETLLPLLPARLSRFKPGDAPLAGVDWELTELLGVGGFGEVWKAQNPYFDGVPPVALKFCLDAEAARTLRHEATVLNQVMRQGKHPGIVQLQHSYLSATPPCLEYEFVEGGDVVGLIRDWHRAGVPPVEQVCGVMLQLAEVVGFAHRLSPPIVHRDLKPANLLLQQGQGGVRLKVADFGIGGVAASQALKDSAKGLPQGLMMTAVATGTYTPLYASPQQRNGTPADPRDDVYALGIIWHQMLTGDLNADRPGGGRWKQKAVERGMTLALLELLEQCFEDDPNDRPRDAAELADRLRPLVGPAAVVPVPAVPTPAPPPPTKQNKPAGASDADEEGDGGSSGVKAIRGWPVESFLTLLTETRKDKGPAEAAVVRRLLDWFQGNGVRVNVMKRGKASMFPCLDYNGQEHWMAVIRTDGRIEFPFQHMLIRPPFDAEDERRELLRRLNTVAGIAIPEDAIFRRPSVLLSVLTHEAALAKFLEVCGWYLAEVRATAVPAATVAPTDRQ